METITKTFNSTAYTCLAYNRISKETENRTVILNKDFGTDTALKIITKKYGNAELVYMDVMDKRSIQEKRAMETVTFMLYAHPLEKPNPALITRTVKNTTYSVVVYDRTQKVTDTRQFILGKELDNDTALKALQKRYNGETLIVVDVLGKNTDETLYGITPDEFLAHSKVIEDSKEG